MQMEAREPAVEFLVVGDWGRLGSDDQLAVSFGMYRVAYDRPIDFVLSVGDNFYEDGVIGLDDPHWWSSFERPYYWDGLSVPWYATLGNHDYRGSVRAQIEYSYRSARWNLPARFYSSTWPGPVRPLVELFCLDTSPMIMDYRAGGLEEMPGIRWPDPYRQLAWLEEGLYHSRARWKIVAGHHPVISGSPVHGTSFDLVDRLEPILQEYNVALYLSGHDHDLQHLRSGGGLDYVVSGAGSNVRQTGRIGRTVFAEATLGFVHVRATQSDIAVSILDAEPTVRHSARLARPQVDQAQIRTLRSALNPT